MEMDLAREVVYDMIAVGVCCGGRRQKTFLVTLSYVGYTTSGVNCALKNSRGCKEPRELASMKPLP